MRHGKLPASNKDYKTTIFVLPLFIGALYTVRSGLTQRDIL